MSFAEADLLVLGASMLGVELVYQVRRRAKRPVGMIVVDRQDRHPYIPLCHERLCGRIPTQTTAVETAAYVTAQRDAKFVHQEIVGFDPVTHVATLGNGDEVRGRVVVVAICSLVEPDCSLAGHDDLLTLKSTSAWEQANAGIERLLRGAQTRAPSILVVGGGISGVELAGELGHLRQQRPPGWGAPAVTLVHAGDRLLPGLTSRAGRRAQTVLGRQGVEVRLRTRLRELGDGRVGLESDGKQAEARDADLAFWAGGLRAPALVAKLGLPLTEAGWLCVGPTLQSFPTPVPSDPEVFAGGDAVRIHGGEGEWPTMQRAIECIWQAKTIARNALELLAEPQGYPHGVPPLRPHGLRTDFPHGVSLGARSLIVYGRIVVDAGPVSVWFRRWLMRRYLERYAP